MTQPSPAKDLDTLFTACLLAVGGFNKTYMRWSYERFLDIREFLAERANLTRHESSTSLTFDYFDWLKQQTHDSPS